MSHLVLEKLNLAYGKAAAVRDLDLAVDAGQLVSLLGPSGCGKTTTMRAVAGLLPPVSGRIVLAGADITRTPAHQRDMGLVFQSYALFPHLSAWDNVAFGLRLRKVAAAELDQRVKAAIASVGLQGFEARLPANLSGGQQQRVAVARAIVLQTAAACCWTSRCRTWTRGCAWRCAPSCAASSASWASRCCTSRTTRRKR